VVKPGARFVGSGGLRTQRCAMRKVKRGENERERVGHNLGRGLVDRNTKGAKSGNVLGGKGQFQRRIRVTAPANGSRGVEKQQRRGKEQLGPGTVKRGKEQKNGVARQNC